MLAEVVQPRTLLVIGAGRLQMPAYTVGRAMGLRVVGVDRDPRAPGLALADVAHQVDTNDIDGVVEIARRERPQGVVTLCTDRPVLTVASVAARLGLIAIDSEAAAIAIDKTRMRDALKRAGVSIPGYRRAGSLAAARAAIAELGLPAILKPPASAGSRGITRISLADELEVAYEHAKTVAGQADVLVEQFVEGPEVSVETISSGDGQHTVVAVTDKRTTGNPYWVETGHVQPSRLSPATLSAIHRVTVDALQALRIQHAAAHVEIKVGERGPVLIEVGPRLGGDFITTELVPRSTGVDMVAAIIRMSLGEPPRLTPSRESASAIRYLSASPGLVTHIQGVEEARCLAGVVRLEVDVKEGDRVRPVRSSLDRPGFVVCEGATAQEAEERSLAAANTVRISTAS